MFRNSVHIAAGRAEMVCGNLLAKIGCYNVQEQCSRCHTEEKQICVPVDKISCAQGNKLKSLSCTFIEHVSQ